MLNLELRAGRTIEIDHAGERLTIKLSEVRKDSVKLGFDGPRSFAIVRSDSGRKLAIVEPQASELAKAMKGGEA